MAIRFGSWMARPLMLGAVLRQARLAVRLFREPRVPTPIKAIPALALLYLISPIDLVPDFLLGVGQLDDLGVLLAAMELFVRLSPGGAQAFHREALAQRRPFTPMAAEDDIIEAKWKHG